MSDHSCLKFTAHMIKLVCQSVNSFVVSVEDMMYTSTYHEYYACTCISVFVAFLNFNKVNDN